MAQHRIASIRVWHKLLIIALIAVVLCAVPTVIFLRASLKEIGTSKLELAGLAPATELVRVLQPLQNHRGLAAAVLSGDQKLADQRLAREKEINAAFARVRAELQDTAKPVIAEIDKAEKEWKSLSTALKDRSYPVEDSYNRHTRLLAQMLRTLESSVDYYGLSLDPEPESYHMVIAAYIDMPKLIEAAGRLRATGTAILGIKQATTEERVTIATMLERARDELEHAEAKILKAVEANGAPMEGLLAAMKKAKADTQKLAAVTDLEFMRIEVLRYDPAEYLTLATAAMDAQFAVIHAARAEIERELNERVNSLRLKLFALLGMVATLLLLGAVAMFWVARSIVRPLNMAVNDANAIAAGRLDSVIVNTGSDEVGQLRRAMRHMQRNLAHIVFSIRENSESVSTAAKEIASSTRDMSARAEAQASSLEETAASMEEMNSSVQQNDESSQNASELASGAAQAAERGRDVVHQVANTMQEINTSSKQIAEIISVIDGIAFQTNILALNAAVEAARAGEQGRGFAVVASEVRALAQRSGQASKEIRTLISESVKKVQAGTREALDAGNAMQDILDAARKVEQTIRLIRVASQDQRQGISQVSRAVEHMNQGTQQNAAMVEEIAATADLLASQADELITAVSAFKLSGASGDIGASGNEGNDDDIHSRMSDQWERELHQQTDSTSESASDPTPAQALPSASARPMLPHGHSDHSSRPPH